MLAVVTGASRSLGRLCAHELAAHGANLLLVACDQLALVDVATEIKLKYPGREVATPGCDPGDPDPLQRVHEAADHLKPVEILVNNAAVQGSIGPAWEVPWHEFEEALRLDFLVPVALCHALIPSMKAIGRRWIINISGGERPGRGRCSPLTRRRKPPSYASSRRLRSRRRANGIRVNAVAPGAFASGMTSVVHSSGENAGQAEAAAAQKLFDSEDTANAKNVARLVVYGSYGIESLTFYGMLPRMGPPETARWEYPFADRSWEAETAEFFAAIHEERRPIGDAAEAVGSMSVIERVYQGAWG